MVEGGDYRIRPVYVPLHALGSQCLAVDHSWQTSRWVAHPKSHFHTVANRRMLWLRKKHPMAAISTTNIDYKVAIGPLSTSAFEKLRSVVEDGLKRFDIPQLPEKPE